MDYFPLFANLKEQPVLVVGAGEVAYRKITLLLKAGASVKIIAKQVGQDVQQLIDSGSVVFLRDTFDDEDVNQAMLTIAATNNDTLNQQISDAAKSRLRLVNVVDNQELCGFIVPAIIDRSPVQIAVSTGGSSPVLARLLREKLESILPEYLGAMANFAKEKRELVKGYLSTLTQRRIFWENLLRNPIFKHSIANHHIDDAEHLLQTCLINQGTQEQNKIGMVTLVGAGPGDVGLLTLKGLQAIQAADIVLYDALVDQSVLDLIRRDATQISVGKRAHQKSVNQDVTNQLLIDYAKQGLHVVRLKGGDPFVFGRGAEEVEVLKDAGVAYAIVPGVTAALGATAYAGIPLTHRNYAQSATMITGHCREEGDEIDWSSLARSKQTLAIYMGTIKAAEISKELIEHGKSAYTPVAIISHGTLKTQKVDIGRLSDLEDLAKKSVRPALIVIGEVVSLHDKCQWFM